MRILATLWILLATLLVATDAAAGACTTPYAATGSPAITSHSPIVGSVGATVKVVGTGLGDTSRAVFAANAGGTIVSKAAGEVDVVVPPMALDGNLTLTTPGGTASILLRVVPRVSGVSADSHTVGSAVTINGSGLADVTSVTINSAPASFHAVSTSEIALASGDEQLATIARETISRLYAERPTEFNDLLE